MKWAKLCLLFAFVCLASPDGWSQDISSTVQARMQSELLTLDIQLLNCAKKIASLNNALKDLKENDQNFIDSLRKQLAEQQETYKTLSTQYSALKSSLARLQTERDVAIACVVVLGAGYVALTIWALVK
jgi:septal ring factor EnvC (AmiA/AmiB activator)